MKVKIPIKTDQKSQSDFEFKQYVHAFFGGIFFILLQRNGYWKDWHSIFGTVLMKHVVCENSFCTNLLLCHAALKWAKLAIPKRYQFVYLVLFTPSTSQIQISYIRGVHLIAWVNNVILLFYLILFHYKMY